MNNQDRGSFLGGLMISAGLVAMMVGIWNISRKIPIHLGMLMFAIAFTVMGYYWPEFGTYAHDAAKGCNPPGCMSLVLEQVAATNRGIIGAIAGFSWINLILLMRLRMKQGNDE